MNYNVKRFMILIQIENWIMIHFNGLIEQL